MIIAIPDGLPILAVEENGLPQGWKKGYCEQCSQIGKSWYTENKFPILKTPSSIIPSE